MSNPLSFLRSSVLGKDIAIVARRHGKTVPAYLKDRMTEALMADIATEVLTRYDFSSDAQIDKALLRFRDLSNELIRALARFKYDAKHRRALGKLRQANTEGALTSTQFDVFATMVSKEDDYSIVKALARLEAARRGLLSIKTHHKIERVSRAR